MKKIKNLFEKKKAEFKFQGAGTGYKLSDSKPVASTSGGSGKKAEVPAAAVPTRRTGGPDENVAKAALARFENKTTGAAGAKPAAPFALRDIMEEEKRQINEEMKLKEQLENRRKLEEQQRRKVSEDENPYKEFESSQLFTCTTLDITSPVSFDLLISQIKSNIYDNFPSDPILRSFMCLCNCNQTISRDETRLKACIDILLKIVTNLTTDKEEDLAKFKRIRRSKIETKVLSLDGALDFLFAIGFSIDTDTDWLVFAEADSGEELKKRMIYIQDILMSPQIIPIELDHQMKYLSMEETTTAVLTLAEDDLHLSSSDVKQFCGHLERTREIHEMFVSKETKARMMSSNNKSNYKPLFTQLRFKFDQDGMQIVQAIFYSTDQLSDVKSWFMVNIGANHLHCSGFDLKFGPTLLAGVESLSKSLAELQLTPAATLLVIPK